MHGRVGVEWKGRGPYIVDSTYSALVKRRECTQSKEKVSVIEA
jgi:predicted nucleic acid-binding Zn ribbon protein